MWKLKYNSLALTFGLLLLIQSIDLSKAKRAWGTNNRKTGGGTDYTRRQSSSNTHVTRPSYPTQSNTGNSHADVAKLSYPNYNSQPNVHGAGQTHGNAAPIGWNVPKQQGPPPAYSPSNVAGGAKTNMHEAPPSYGASNVHTPISASHAHGVQSSYPSQHLPPGGSYHAPGAIPAGASYYPSSGHLPQGASYYPQGGVHMQPGASYYPGGHIPQGASYIPAGAAIPVGATYYSSPPQQSSSGLGFGSGLLGGAIGGAILGHALTPSNTRVIEHAPAQNSGGAGGDGKIIIINNGQPATAENVNGTTVITTGGAAGMAGAAAGMPGAPGAPGGAAGMPGAAGAPGAAAGMPGAAGAPGAPDGMSGAPGAPGGMPGAPGAPGALAGMPGAPGAPGAPADSNTPLAPMAPEGGGIICVPVRVNDTDPNDNTKMIEVEKVACYPAPPPPQPQPAGENSGQPGSPPLAPMNAAPGQPAQQFQQFATQSTLISEQSSIRTSGGSTIHVGIISYIYTFMTIILAYKMF